MAKNLMTTNHLRHVEPVMSFPSGAGKIPNLNAVTLGKALATEKDHLIFPSHEFSRQALVPSPDKVMFFSSLSFWCFPILIHPCLLMSFFCDYSQYLEMYRKSVEDPARFWSEIASRYYWKQKWGRQVYLENLDVRNGPISIEVFHPPIISSSSWSVLFNLFCSTYFVQLLCCIAVVQRRYHQHCLQLLGQKCGSRTWRQNCHLLGRQRAWIWWHFNLHSASPPCLPGIKF